MRSQNAAIFPLAPPNRACGLACVTSSTHFSCKTQSKDNAPIFLSVHEATIFQAKIAILEKNEVKSAVATRLLHFTATPENRNVSSGFIDCLRRFHGMDGAEGETHERVFTGVFE
jgi:hypothetical protein